jgi:hypothetical protein
VSKKRPWATSVAGTGYRAPAGLGEGFRYDQKKNPA